MYLVDIPYPPHRPRVWRHNGTGIVEGHGGRIRRPSIADAFNELIIAAEKHEGISSE
jgi:hypothetical protein